MYLSLFLLVDTLVEKYGMGHITTVKCDTCTYEKEIHSSGVHETEGGSLKVYCEDDAFICPKCNKDEPKGITDTLTSYH